MIKLLVLTVATIILLVIFITSLIFAFVKKTKRLLVLAVLSFLILFSTGIYTLYFSLKKAKRITQTAFEQVFPTFDSDKPDTEANKKNFRNFLKTDITPDVKYIYCFDDAIGQDADYMFSFSCDSLTAKKIIERNGLRKDSLTENPENMQNDFFWWDKKKIEELDCYSWHSNYERKNVHKLFWYDEQNQKAYYFEYDM